MDLVSAHTNKVWTTMLAEDTNTVLLHLLPSVTAAETMDPGRCGDPSEPDTENFG